MAHGATVLVVDDDPSIRDFVEATLEDEGYGVLSASDGEAALALVGEQPCAVLLDMRMPILDGWGFAEAYRALPGAHAPIVVMTAAENAAAWAEEIGAAGVLAKPFRLDDLLAVVAQHCRV
jgi:CheY-like chemotaxis protein